MADCGSENLCPDCACEANIRPVMRAKIKSEVNVSLCRMAASRDPNVAVAPTSGSTGGESLAPMAGASTAESSSERSTSWRTRGPCFVQRVLFAEMSIWPTFAAKENLLLSRSWRTTIASWNLRPAIVGRPTPPKWATEATCASGSFRDGAATRHAVFKQADRAFGFVPCLQPAQAAQRSVT
jgi:hypothetical protein